MIFRSPFPEVSIPDVALDRYVFGNVERFADKPALVEGQTGRALTYAQLYDSVRRAASSLARRGLKKGDVLAVFSPNAPEYAVAFHAAIMIGGVVTTINPLCTEEEVGKQLADSGAKYLVTVPALLDKARGTQRARGLRLRRGRGRDAVRVSARRRRRRARSSHKSARRPGRAPVFERDDGRL
jgi:acyl-CoA synthetase (AMP-forming)/AMP-acid ligase II